MVRFPLVPVGDWIAVLGAFGMVLFLTLTSHRPPLPAEAARGTTTEPVAAGDASAGRFAASVADGFP